MNKNDNSETFALSKDVAIKTVSVLDDNQKYGRTRGNVLKQFYDYRAGLPEAKALWGTKVFFGACKSLDILEKVEGCYIPTETALNNNKDLFEYHEESNTWGIAYSKQVEWTEAYLTQIEVKAEELREAFEQMKKLKAAQKRAIDKAQREFNSKFGA